MISLRSTTWFLLVSLLFVSAGYPVSESNQKDGTVAEVRIDANVAYQRMDGFGSSQRLFDDPHLIGGPDHSYDRSRGLVVPVDQQNEILHLLYTELKLTRVRPGIYPVDLQPVKNGEFFFEW